MNQRATDKDLERVEVEDPINDGTARSPGQGPGLCTQVSIRGATPRDCEGLRGMFSRASSETIYRRFHIPYPEVPERTLALMVDADHHDKESLVAVAEEEIVGHAMFAGSHYTMRDGVWHVRMPLGTSEPGAYTSRTLSRVA